MHAFMSQILELKITLGFIFKVIKFVSSKYLQRDVGREKIYRAKSKFRHSCLYQNPHHLIHTILVPSAKVAI